MKINIKTRNKIIGALIIAFIISTVASKTIFIPNTNKINIPFLAKLFYPKKNTQMQNTFYQLVNSSISTMNPLSYGIYAKEDSKLNTTFIRITKNAKWKVIIDEVNGKKIKVLVPSDFQL